MIRGSLSRLAGAAIVTTLATGLAAAPAMAKTKTLTVCKHGCRYTTIQSAVNASGKGATIKVRPGHYSEGVIVSGHKHDGLNIIGTGKTPAAVVLDGTHAKGPGGAAQNGIDGEGVDDLTLKNMKAEHYAANGFFINSCDGFNMQNLIAGFNHSYGLFVFKCVGGQMIQSTGFGNGDSGFYVGGTPFQKKPKTTLLNHDTGYENVLGYSGTNSKYILIENSMFYNNGAGVVPNTLDSEPFEPATSGVIKNNKIFWNNFDYYKSGSPVKTVSGGLAGGSANYPIGAGVILFGTTGWTVENNQIFGNWLWGGAAFSDPTNKTGKALNTGNRFMDNTMGDSGQDPNGTDFFNDGSGHGTCFQDNGTVTLATSTTDPDLYPTCPSDAGSGTVNGDTNQVQMLLGIVTSNPPSKMEDFWHRHSHITIKGITPLAG